MIITGAVGRPTGSTILAGNIRSLDPAAYRLAVKPDGTLVLQGAYKYFTGKSGVDWEDIPTHIISDNIEVMP